MGNNEDLVGAIGRLIERVDLYEGEGEAIECLIPLDDHPFLDEDVDINVLVEDLTREMQQLGVTVGEVALVDEAGNEHPLPLSPRRRQHWHAQYLLDACGNPVPTTDFRAVARLLCNLKKRTVTQTFLRYRGRAIEIRTIFTVHNLATLSAASPVLWETMVFSRHQHLGGTTMRYHSIKAAKTGHSWLVAYTKTFLKMGWKQRRKPTIHQAAAILRHERQSAAEAARRWQ